MDVNSLPTCITCENLPGCRLLLGKKGRRQVFDPGKLITEDNFRECDQWKLAGVAECGARETLLGLGAAVHKAVEAIYNRGTSVDDPPVDEELLEEGEILLAEDLPKNLTEIRPGITVDEREEQLRYELDEDGAVALDSEENPIPRGRFELATYASRPEFPLRLQASDVLMWGKDILIEAILRRERDLGLWTQGEEMPQLKNRKTTRAAAPATPKTDEGQETKPGPATAKKKVLKKNMAKAPSKAKARASDEEAPAEAAVSAAGAGQVDISALEEKIDSLIQEARERETRLTNRLEQAESQLLIAQTLAHDATMQVLMTMAAFHGVTITDDQGNEVALCPQDEEGNPMVDGMNLYTADEPDTLLYYLQQGEEDSGE